MQFRLKKTLFFPEKEGRDSAAEIERAGSLGLRVYSAGGGQIYAQTLPHALEMNLSIIKGEYRGDTFFPEFDESMWDKVCCEEHDRFEYRVYVRK